jgi:hypothetical protein
MDSTVDLVEVREESTGKVRRPDAVEHLINRLEVDGGSGKREAASVQRSGMTRPKGEFVPLTSMLSRGVSRLSEGIVYSRKRAIMDSSSPPVERRNGDEMRMQP